MDVLHVLDMVQKLSRPQHCFYCAAIDLRKHQAHVSREMWCHLLGVPADASQECPQLCFLKSVCRGMFVPASRSSDVDMLEVFSILFL